MPTVRYAHLLLPSPQGLLEYDILEDAVFLGPGPRGGLTAEASPFPAATIALTRTEAGFRAKPLPGEAAPEINGESSSDPSRADAVLSDGDRVRIAGQVALFRTDRGPVRTRPAPPPQGGPARVPATRSGPETRARSSGSGALLRLLGAAIVLAAAARAVGHLKSIKAAREQARPELPSTPVLMEELPSRAGRSLIVLRDYARSHPEKLGEAARRYQSFVEHFSGAAEAEVAQERLRELMERWAEREVLGVEEQVDLLVAAGQFNRAERVVREFEERFGATRAGPRVQPQREKIRTQAKTALAELTRMAKVLIAKNPKQAVNLLAGADVAYPADMAAAVGALLTAARVRAKAERGTRRAPRRRDPLRRDPPRGNPPDREPTPGTPDPRPPTPPGPDSGDPAPARGEDAEQLAKRAWQGARDHLLNGNYAEAMLGYTMLTDRFGKTALVRENQNSIAAGFYAARVGKEGPKALLNVPVEEKRGRLEFEYTFSRPEELEDFEEEQPFASEKLVDIEHKRGNVSMAGTSGFMHTLVFLPDVRIEANVTADAAHDFGLIAIEDSDQYRAILFDVNNTRFKLKKNDNQRPNPGHLLWYIGQGVWRDADADAHGYIKIAERPNSKLKDGDRVKLELERMKGNRCEVGFGAPSDGVALRGQVKGDDGSTMASARVGVFVDTGIVRIHQIKISGRVDMSWFKGHLAWLVKSDPGPP